MAQAVKTFQIVEFDDGSTRVISTDKRQMARWYALDYLQDKAQKTSQGAYVALLSPAFYFSAGFRKRDK
ncbi:hypothetical protein ARG35_02890 [Listeria monocytogenes]|nr:hypothetical protein [Listeria monocytogenes]EAE2195920.1 hypothetical protein [Listeria monocytogenes]EAE2217979.1 hypothetical protein [Listeria monocytogenes]EAE2226991.1 hypothetical protein [Listeria monocytogenes]